MKSISTLMTLMILLTAFSLSAQTTIGVTAGASFANVTIKSGFISASPKSKTGITAGIVIDAPLSTNFNFQPALNFVQKGYKIKDDVGTETVNFNYLEVPLNFVYTTERNEGFFIGAGPSVSYGLSGKDKIKYSGGSMPDDNQKIKFGSGADQVKAFDFGANAVAGYKFNGGFMVSGNYNLGLTKINNDDGSGDAGAIKNKYFSIKIGYMFGGNKHK
ncbi:MAG: porin family protein [Bacteroidia bacterium]